MSPEIWEIGNLQGVGCGPNDHGAGKPRCTLTKARAVPSATPETKSHRQTQWTEMVPALNPVSWGLGRQMVKAGRTEDWRLGSTRGKEDSRGLRARWLQEHPHLDLLVLPRWQHLLCALRVGVRPQTSWSPNQGSVNTSILKLFRK